MDDKHTMVRIRKVDKDRLKDLAETQNRTQVQIIALALDALAGPNQPAPAPEPTPQPVERRDVYHVEGL